MGTKYMLGTERNFLELGLDVAAVKLEESLVRASGALTSEKGGPQIEVPDKQFWARTSGEEE